MWFNFTINISINYYSFLFIDMSIYVPILNSKMVHTTTTGALSE